MRKVICYTMKIKLRSYFYNHHWETLSGGGVAWGFMSGRLPSYLEEQFYKTVACEQALGGMEGERKEEGLYAHLKFYCFAPFLTFL